jgi:hypothetical protein
VALAQDSNTTAVINSVLTEVNYYLRMGLKVPPGAEKRPPAEPPSARWRRIGVAQRDELSIVPIAIVFCFAALLVDAVLGGHGRAVIADRIAAVVQGPSSEIAVGSTHR